MVREDVIAGVKRETIWWIGQRATKVASEAHASMEINPFLAPLMSALHGFSTPWELIEFMLNGHFYIGHGTGFGKLIDEKILPNVFRTQKLSKAARRDGGMQDACFDNIDHIVDRDGLRYLLSLKAGRWTIQLGQAVQLNKSFQALIERRAQGSTAFESIVVGTFYGTESRLTDKYNVLRGTDKGASHDVVDISGDVSVYAGRKFWTWLGGHTDTQEWVMIGILEAVAERRAQTESALATTAQVEASVTQRFGAMTELTSVEDWLTFLRAVNP